MTTASSTAGEPLCCGQGGPWAPEGKPLVVGCQLCPNSLTYWRQGREHLLPVKPLGERAEQP